MTSTFEKEEINGLLFELLSRPVAFHPVLARAAGGAAAGLFLSQLFYWHGKGRHEAGWIYKDWREWQEETCLTQDEQRGARKLLKAKKIIEESDVRKLGIDFYKSTLAFRINFEALKKCIMGENDPQSPVVEGGGNIPPRGAENPTPEGGDSHPGSPEFPPQEAEISPEISPETSAEEDFPSAKPSAKKKNKTTPPSPGLPPGPLFKKRESGIVTWTLEDQEAAAEIEAGHDAKSIQEVVKALRKEGKDPLPGRVLRALVNAEAAKVKEEAEDRAHAEREERKAEADAKVLAEAKALIAGVDVKAEIFSRGKAMKRAA